MKHSRSTGSARESKHYVLYHFLRRDELLNMVDEDPDLLAAARAQVLQLQHIFSFSLCLLERLQLRKHCKPGRHVTHS